MVGGTTVGNYQLLERIGAGGMGEVWLAKHTLIGRRAAIKLLQPGLSILPEIVNRFFNEARAATSIADPGIVQIFDFGQHTDGSAYIVMELLEGETLEARCRRRPLPVDEALRILRQVASSLGAAHARGIVHRDLKPENIFLIRDPEVPGGERAKILDFGIAKLLGENQVKTQTSVVMGTPAFMSPEQCRGAGRVDERSDVYSLGCVLFATITGRPPFQAEGAGDIIAMHLREPAPALSSFVRVGRDIDALVARCLEKDPAQRYRSGSELAGAIGAVITHLSSPLAAVLAPTVPPTVPPPRSAQVAAVATPTTLSGSVGSTSTPPAHRSKLPLALAGAGVIAAGSIVAYVALRSPDAPSAPTAAPTPVEKSPAPAPAAAAAAPAPATPPRDDRAEQAKLRILRVLAAFTEWSSKHAGARCPTTADLPADGERLDDPWGHPISITCTDQPADQIVGAVSPGPDGKLGTDDDIASWTLGRDVTSFVHGARWKVAAASPTARHAATHPAPASPPAHAASPAPHTAPPATEIPAARKADPDDDIPRSRK